MKQVYFLVSSFLSVFSLTCSVPLFVSPGNVKNSHGLVVVHPTTYDGCVELAALQLGYWASGTSAFEACFKSSKEMVKDHLLQASFGEE